MKRHDKALYWILGAIFLASSVASFFFFFTDRSVEGLVLEVQVDNEVVGQIPLSNEREERILEISRDAGYNAFAVGPDGVRMVSSDCRGSDCLRAPAIRMKGSVIVCLPHRVILRISGPLGPAGSSNGRERVDGVSY